jgi:cellulose synthase operon protein C
VFEFPKHLYAASDHGHPFLSFCEALLMNRSLSAVRSLVTVAAVLVASPLWAQPNSSPEAELERFAAEIQSASSTVEALAKVQALDRFRTFVVQEDYAALSTELATKVRSPLVQFALLRQAARARLDVHDFSDGVNGMQGAMAGQGCLTDWMVVGPFENASMQGFYEPLPVESGTSGPYEGKVGEVDWRSLSDPHHLCVYYLGSFVRPSTAAVAYLSTRVDSPRARPATILVGAQGAYSLWVNGRLVGRRTEDQGMGIDNDGWNIDLAKGVNDIVVKVGSTGQGSMSLVARLVDRNLAPLKDVSVTGHFEPRTLETSSTPQPHPAAVLALIEDAATRLARDPQTAVWAAWLWKEQQPSHTGTPWRDVGESLLENTAGLGEGLVGARHLSIAAELFEEHWRKLQILSQAHTLAPSEPFIATRLSREYGAGLSSLEAFKQRELLEGVLKDDPEFLLALLELADWYQANDLSYEALRLLETSTLARRLDVPAYVRRLADLHEQIGVEATARTLRDQARRVSGLSGAFVWRQMREHAQRGELDEALKLVEAQARLTPWTTQWTTQRAVLLRAAGQLDEALAVYDELIAMVPTEASFHDQKGRLLLAMGLVDEAEEVLEQALALRPQDQDLEELLSLLRPQMDRFWEPWMRDDMRQIAETSPAGSYNYDTLIDQTVIKVAPNGLARQASQRVDRIIEPDGVDQGRVHRVTYRIGDERVDVLRVRVYKADGTISEDFDQWRSGDSRKRSTTYNDTAYVNLRANNVEVGDLVEFRYVVSQVANENFRGDYFGDVTYVQNIRPIARSRYAVIYPKNWSLYFRPPALPHTRKDNVMPDGRPAEGEKITLFELENIPRVHTDTGAPGFTEVYDHIIVSNKETFDEIGRWWWNLVKEQLVVDENIRQTVVELTRGLTDDASKVRAIYNYVAKNTRYLHVGLGIHGWKPYRTTTVMRNRFGDCKDKAALLKVMLEEAGVAAELVLVRTRRLGLVDDFPASMHIFNHAVTYVPSLDLYLDATAEFNGAFELTSMDQGAQGLIVKDGGRTRWVTLPVDAAIANLMEQNLEVDLTGDEPVVRGTLVAHGANAVYFRQTLEDPERRDEVFEQHLSRTYPGARLVSATYENLADLDQPTRITFEFKGGNILRRSDMSTFLYPYGAPRDLLSTYARESTRNQPLTLRVPFMNQTRMRYRVAATQHFDRVPKPVQIDSKFGGLDIQYHSEGDSLVVDIRYSIDVNRVELAEYFEFRRFVSEMTSALNETIGVGDDARTASPATGGGAP